MSDRDFSRLLQQNRGFLQRRKRTTDIVLEALFPFAKGVRRLDEHIEDLGIKDRLNQALWNEGYIQVSREVSEEFRGFVGDIFRWEFNPNWGCR